MTLVLPGGNYARAHTYSGVRPTVEGPIDIRIRVSGEWDPIVGGGTRRLISTDVFTCLLLPNWDSPTGGEMSMFWDNSSGGGTTLDGTVPLPFIGVPGTYWLRFLATDDGTGNAIGEFFWSATNTDDPDEVNWVLHETVTPEDAPFTFGTVMGFSTSVGDGSNPTEPWCIHATQVEFGATVVANPVFSEASSAPFFDSAGNEWDLDANAYLGECPFVEEDPDPPPDSSCGLVLPEDQPGYAGTTEYFPSASSSWEFLARIESSWPSDRTDRLAGEIGATIGISIDQGHLVVSWDDGPSWSEIASPSPLPFMDAEGTYWLRVLIEDDSGDANVSMSWSADDIDDPAMVSTWNIVRSGSTAKAFTFDYSSWPNGGFGVGDVVGGDPYPCVVRVAEVSIDGTPVLRPEFTQETSMPFIDSLGVTWTAHGDVYLECNELPPPVDPGVGSWLLASTYSGGSYAGFPYGGTVGAASVVEGAIELAPVINEPVVPGPLPLVNPEITGPVHLDSVYGMPIVPGPYVPSLDDLPPDLGDPVPPPPRLRLREIDEVPLAIQCQPTLNGVGSGSFTLYGPQSVALDTRVTFEVGSTAVFTGRVTSARDTLLSSGEEAEYITEYDVEGTLESMRNVIVYPEFGATNPTTGIGQPVQDERILDWHSRQHRFDSTENVAGLAYASTIAASFGPDEAFPIPDAWPWPGTRWLWGTNPAAPARRGWCFFRAPFNYPHPQKAQIWLVAHDYAELAVDGVPILECDTPGQAKRVELELRQGSHLITMRGYNERGNAGVMAAVVGLMDDGTYRLPPEQYTNTMWRCIPYPTASFRVTAGHLLHALRDEAIIRGVQGIGWTFSFTRQLDSAGRPWPVPLSPIIIRVGSTYLDVLQQLVDEHIDFAVSPSGRTLHAWIKDSGTGNVQDLPWTPGEDLLEHSVERR